MTSRKTVQFVSKHSVDQTGAESRMFVEDFHLGIVPIYGREKAYNVKIEPYNQEIENIVIKAFPTDYSVSRDLNAAVFGFIQSAAKMLSFTGHAYYELIYVCDDSQPKPDSFFLEDIPPSSIYKLINNYVQVVPKDATEYYKSKRLIKIPARDIIAISMPKELGGARKFTKSLKQMNLLSKLPPDFSLEEMAFSTKKIGFDFLEWQNRIEIAKAKTTRIYGWNARSLWNEKCLDFYIFHRHLVFQRSQAILRKYILEAMNETLKRAGGEMNFNARIIMTGLPSIQDLDKMIEDLHSGELPFEAAAKVGS